MKMLARLILIKFLTQALQLYTSHGFHRPQLATDKPVSFRLQLFLEQLLTDIWVSSPQGSTLKHIDDYISTLWLQETFYNFYPFSDHSFLSSSYSPLGLVCLIFSRDSSKTESRLLIYQDQVKTVLLLETLMTKIEN